MSAHVPEQPPKSNLESPAEVDTQIAKSLIELIAYLEVDAAPISKMAAHCLRMARLAIGEAAGVSTEPDKSIWIGSGSTH